MPNPISKLLSLGDGKRLRQYRRIVDKINSLEDGLSALTDAELRATADHLRERAAPGVLSGEDDPFRPESMVYSDSRSDPGAPPLEAPDPAGGNPLG